MGKDRYSITRAIIDDLKANRRKINLIVDQYIHMIQIAATVGMFMGGLL